ncbi:MAG: hypothetical protein ISP90_10790 [Nevskia sp.]|nr:hypothetical protein [Nevskia sp.]
MKSRKEDRSRARGPAGAALLGLIAAMAFSPLVPAASAAPAVYTFSVLFSFPGAYSGTLYNAPAISLIQGSDGNFYGINQQAADGSDCGSFFRLTAAGTYTQLHAFACTPDTDGTIPSGRLVEGTDGKFYGITDTGGSGHLGTIFSVTTGGVLTKLHDFTQAGPEGVSPAATYRMQNPLQLGADGNFYGVANYSPGCNCQSAIYRMTPAGSVSVVGKLGIPADLGGAVSSFFQDADGSFYGTTGVSSVNDGTVFKLASDGTLTTLHTFHAADGSEHPDLLLRGSDGNLYGRIDAGASSTDAIFELTPAGSFSVVYQFPYDAASFFLQNLRVLQRLADGSFLGLAANGGAPYQGDNQIEGEFFSLVPGGEPVALYGFPLDVADGQTRGGQAPGDISLASDGNYYGTTYLGGAHGVGSVFKLSTSAAPAPTVTIAASPNPITVGHSTTLTWSSANATSCTASGAWAGNEPLSGSLSESPASAGTDVYTLSCTGTGGTTSASAKLSVNPAPPPAPTVTITANPASITLGNSTALNWSTTNATACTASGGWTGAEPTAGTANESPDRAGTILYTLSCSGAGGSASASASVSVAAAPPPTVSITANPAAITVGDSTTLSWTSTNATSCTASGSWSGAQATSGTQHEAPAAAGTASYTLSCSGPGGTIAAAATVTVAAPRTSGGSSGDSGGGGFGAGSLFGLGLFALARHRRGRRDTACG